MNYRYCTSFALLVSLFSIKGFCQTKPVVDSTHFTDSTSPKPVFGLKAGLNMQSITSTDWVNTTNTGFMGGFFAGLHKNRVTLRAEVLISTTQYKSIVPIDSEGNIGNFNIVHLNVPVLLDVEIIKNHLSVYAGPQYSNMISATKKTAFDGDPKVVFKSGEFAGVAGIEGKFCKHILIGGRYVYGFTDLNNEAFTSTEKWQNRAFQVYIGYSFL